MAQVRYWLWLSSHTELSPKTKIKVIEHFGDAERAYFASDEDYFNIPDISEQDAKRLQERDIAKADRIQGECERMGVSILCLTDSAYPQRLKNTFAPPLVLYVKGNLPDVDNDPAVAVIGTRSCSPYGMKMGRKLAYECCKCGAALISTLSRGIDEAAVRGALLAGGRSIGVLGTAIGAESSALLDDIAASGALVSEYPPGTKGMKHFFRDRNRIAAGLSCGVAVVEAPRTSGALLFASEAYEQGREIFAVPGNADSENSAGTNNLIKQGAKAVTCGWDIMEEFEMMFPGKISDAISAACPEQKVDITQSTENSETRRFLTENAETRDECPASTGKAVDNKTDCDYIDIRQMLEGLNDDQLKIVSVLDKDGTHVDDIIERTGLTVPKVLSQLTILEIKGCIRRLPGRRIILNIAKK